MLFSILEAKTERPLLFLRSYDKKYVCLFALSYSRSDITHLELSLNLAKIASKFLSDQKWNKSLQKKKIKK